MDDKTKKEYKEKVNEQTATIEAEVKLVPKRKKITKPVTTGYILFAVDTHTKVWAENPGLQFDEISRLVSFLNCFYIV